VVRLRYQFPPLRCLTDGTIDFFSPAINGSQDLGLPAFTAADSPFPGLFLFVYRNRLVIFISHRLSLTICHMVSIIILSIHLTSNKIANNATDCSSDDGRLGISANCLAQECTPSWAHDNTPEVPVLVISRMGSTCE